MKLDINDFYSNGKINITDKGWIELQRFCKTIIFKQYGLKFDRSTQEDIISICLLGCYDNLEKYDAQKNNELGGFMYWIVRGEVTKYLQKAIKEVQTDMTHEDFIAWMEDKQIQRDNL